MFLEKFISSMYLFLFCLFILLSFSSVVFLLPNFIYFSCIMNDVEKVEQNLLFSLIYITFFVKKIQSTLKFRLEKLICLQFCHIRL